MPAFRTLILCGLVCAPVAASAQSQAPSDSVRMANNVRLLQFMQVFQLATSAELAPAINSLLQDDGAHMRMAPRRPIAPGDSERAADIVTTTRAALAKYTNVDTAVAAGYVKFLPFVEDQIVYHYNNIGNVRGMLGNFDVKKPVSLLYKKDEKGAMKLVGAMYSAIPTATLQDLDMRLPTSIAHWHEHVDFCAPSRDSVRAGVVKTDGATASRWVKIATREDCVAVGGQFIPRIFGWMAHVYMFASDDPRVIWGGEHGSMDVHTEH